MRKLMLQITAAVLALFVAVEPVFSEFDARPVRKDFRDIYEGKLLPDPEGNPNRIQLNLGNDYTIYFTRPDKGEREKATNPCQFVGYGDIEESFLSFSTCKPDSGGIVQLDGITKFITFDEKNEGVILLKDDGADVLDRHVSADDRKERK